jgi:hypothetical protein
MKAAYFFSCLLAMASGIVSYAQSIYHFQYNFNPSANATGFQAFLVRYDDGSGLLRVRYTSPQTAQLVLVEMDTEENFLTDPASGKTDTSLLLLTPNNPRFIIGDNSTLFNPPGFQFAYNKATGFYEPAGVTASPTNAVMDRATSFTAALMEGPALTREFVSAFFSADEDFYTNLFKSPGRGLSAAEQNTKLYLLVAADTLDESIGSSCAMDMKRIGEAFSGIAAYLGIKLVTNMISGASYSKQNVQAAINNLKPSRNDLVVFYYSGHGFRKAAGQRFPFIKLKTHHTTREDVFNNSLNMEDIFAAIKKKNARFNLVFSDCCNNDIETSNSIGSKPGKTKSSGIQWDPDNCRRLFFNTTPQSILATAADNGQRASSNNEFGGFFSYYFKTCLENYCSKLKSNVSWDQVLQDAQTQTIYKAKHTYCDKPYIPANICNQYPYYIIR